MNNVLFDPHVIQIIRSYLPHGLFEQFQDIIDNLELKINELNLSKKRIVNILHKQYEINDEL